MNYEQRKSLVNNTNNGNHINQEPEFSGYSKEVEMLKCDKCERMIEQFEHYRDGGLCWKCIERIGK